METVIILELIKFWCIVNRLLVALYAVNSGGGYTKVCEVLREIINILIASSVATKRLTLSSRVEVVGRLIYQFGALI